MRTLATLLLLSAAALAQSEAFCALRDPTRQIYGVYPDATTHRSIVRTVGAGARDEVAKRLPFGLHFNELGQHTLYVAAKGQVPIGMIHVRSETGRWGLMEIAWALDVDLRIQDFSFQRCRNRNRRKLLAEGFRKQLWGLGIEDLGRILTPDGKAIAPGKLRVPAGAEELVIALVRSAMKTIVVTESVWAPDLKILRLLREGLTAFPGGASVVPVKTVYTKELLHSIAVDMRTGDSVFDRSGVKVLRVRDDGKNVLGCVVRTDWRAGGHRLVLWWKVDPAGTLRSVTTSGGWPDAEIRESFESLQGRSLDSLAGCRVPTELAALEAMLVARHHLAAK